MIHDPRTDTEPIVVLPGGDCVLKAVLDTFTHLQARGHLIEFDEWGDVRVTPPVHPDCAYVLSSNAVDVQAILTSDSRRIN